MIEVKPKEAYYKFALTSARYYHMNHFGVVLIVCTYILLLDLQGEYPTGKIVTSSYTERYLWKSCLCL